MSTPGGSLGLPTGQLSCMRCSFMLWNEGRKRWNICATEVAKVTYPEPNPKVDQSAMELVGYRMSRREMWDVYHSVYLLWRCPGSPSCGASRRRRAIQDILSSLQTRLQRRMYSAETEGPGAHGRERVGTEPLQSYEGVLWATCQKAVETAEALCDDLERLNDKYRGRSRVHSQNRSCCRTHSGSCHRTQSGSHPREWSRNQSRDWLRGWIRTCSESCPHADHQCMRSQSQANPKIEGWASVILRMKT